MIGLDTNILIRYIVQDDPVQSEMVNTYIAANTSPETPAYVNAIVLCEMVRVLKRAYKYEKAVICAVLKQLLNTRELIVEQSDAARQALSAFFAGDADFSDYYLAAQNRLAGCTKTVTLDRIASRYPDFELLDATRTKK